MATEITSQITTSVLTRDKASTPTTASRQDSAVIGQILPESESDKVETQSQTTAAVAPTAEKLEQVVSDINNYVQTINRELQFRVDEALPLGRAVITVIDAETDETIREIPSEEVLALAERLSEQAEKDSSKQIEGLIISAQA